MRTYIISPCYHSLNNGSVEQQGYNVICHFDKWKASHGAVELCETAVLRREKQRSITRKKPQVYGKDYKITYHQCQSETGVTDVRLELYR